MLRTALLVGMFACLWLHSLVAQYSPTECAAIRSNALSNPHRLDTLAMVSHCPGIYAEVFSTLLADSSALSDSATYHRVYYHAAYREEAGIFTAANSIVNNGSAPLMARLGAAAVLVAYETGGGPFVLQQFVSYTGDPDCWVRQGMFSRPGATALPTDHVATAYATATSILSSGAPAGLKYFARCVERITDPALKSLGVPPVNNYRFSWPSDFDYVSGCGRTIVLRNKAYTLVTVELRYTHGTLHERYVSLPPRKVGMAYSQTDWTVPGTTSSAVVRWKSTLSSITISVNSTLC